MAQKRMFDRAIIDTDRFMDLGMSSKALYFLLGMEADDEGFVSYKKVMRIHGGNQDDIKTLAAKNFIIAFKSGVVVITDWNNNNYLDKNRMRETEYQKEKKMLVLTNKGKYELNIGSTSIEEYSIEEKRVEVEKKEENTEPPKVGSLPLEEDPEIQECDEDGTPIVRKKKKLSPIQPPTPSLAQRAAEIRMKKLPPAFEYQRELIKLKESTWKIDKIVALVWHRKGYAFSNWDQFNNKLAMDRKYAKSIEGYDGKEITKTMEICEEDSIKGNYEWGITTVAKKIADVINKKSKKTYSSGDVASMIRL